MENLVLGGIGETMNGKFVKFVKYGDIYLIISKHVKIEDVSDLIDCEPLGSISYHKRWDKWVFIATSNEYIFNAEYLKDIIKFMGSLK